MHPSHWSPVGLGGIREAYTIYVYFELIMKVIDDDDDAFDDDERKK